MKALIALLLIVSFENARTAEETTLQSILEELENLKNIISQQQTIISQQQTKIGSLEENLKSVTEQNRKLQEEVVLEIRPGSHQRKDEPAADNSSE